MKRFLSIALAFLIIISVFSLPAAAADNAKMANFIVFVRFAGDSDNVFADSGNYADIKKMYDYYPSPYADLAGASELDKTLDISFKNYIKTISRGKLTIENVFPQDNGNGFSVLTLPFSQETFTNDENADASQIIEEVLNASNNGSLPVGNEKLDNRESEVLDNLTIIVQYQSDVTNGSPLYSHKGNGGTSTLLGGRYYIGTYNLMTSYTILEDPYMKQGVISHEFLHSVGLPDLYRYSGGGDPVANWDLMATTGSYMQYPLTYLRHLQGWLPMQTAYTTGHYTLDASGSDSDNVLLKLSTPISDSEFFCLEYRKKPAATMANLGFETKIPAEGLLMYRVNNALEYLTNKSPDSDYIYVFRPGETGIHNSEGAIINAPVSPDAGETSWGSTDFTKTCTEDTIFYSDGMNSGITITNVAYSADKSQISFDVTFPDYTALGLWKKRAVTANDGSYGTSLAVAENGDIFTAVSSWGDNIETVVQKQSGLVNSTIARMSDVSSPVLGFNSNTLWLAHQNSMGSVLILKKYQNNAFSKISEITCDNYFSSVKMFNDGNQLYIAVVDGGASAKIYRIDDSGPVLVNDKLVASGDNSYANPDFAIFNGKLYALYSVFGGWGNSVETGTHIKSADISGGEWTDVASFDTSNYNAHTLTVMNDRLTGLAGGNGTPILITYDGTDCQTEDLAFASNITVGLGLTAKDGFIAVSTINNSGASEIYVRDNSSEFVKLGGTLSTDSQNIVIAAENNRIWALVGNSSGGSLRTKAVRKPAVTPLQGAALDSEAGYIYLPKLTSGLDGLIEVTNGELNIQRTEAFVGTGRRIEVIDKDSDLYQAFETVVIADLNSDGVTDVFDVVCEEMAVNSLYEPDGAYFAAADADGNGVIEANDYSIAVNIVLSK